MGSYKDLHWPGKVVLFLRHFATISRHGVLCYWTVTGRSQGKAREQTGTKEKYKGFGVRNPECKAHLYP